MTQYDDYLDWCRLMGCNATEGTRKLGVTPNFPSRLRRGKARITIHLALAMAALAAGLPPWPAQAPLTAAADEPVSSPARVA